jgi:hypothetical protein
VRWQQASGQGNHADDAGGSGKGRNVKRRHLKEQRPHGSASPPRSDNAEYFAGHKQA